MEPVPSTLRLDMNDTFECVSIAITNDNIVEGTETFYVRFLETDDNQIMIAGNNTAPVFIEDDESKYIIPFSILVAITASSSLVPYRTLQFRAIYLCFVFAVVVLEFGEVNYTFPENTTSTSEAVLSVIIANFDDLVINDQVSVTIASTMSGNATTTDGKATVISQKSLF